MRAFLPCLMLLAAATASAGTVVPDHRPVASEATRVASAWRFDPATSASAARTSLPAPVLAPAGAEGGTVDAFGLVTRTQFAGGIALSMVVAAPLDANASPDLAIADAAGCAVHLLFNDGLGHFAAGPDLTFPSQSYGEGTVYGVAAGDLDGDGDQDLAVTFYGAGGPTRADSVAVFENLAGVFTRRGTYAVGVAPTRPTIADWSGDGIPDLVVPVNGSPWLAVLRGRGGFAFDSMVALPASPGGTAATVGDVDHDGRAEVLLAYEDCNSLSRYHADVAGALSYAGEVGFQWGANVPALADLDADGWLDLAVTNSHRSVTVLPNVGGAFPAWSELPTLGPTFDVQPFDMNGDGRLDLIATEDINDAVATLLQAQGGGHATAQWGGGIGPAWCGVADLDDDGLPDVVTSEQWGPWITIAWGESGGRLHSSREFDAGVAPHDLTVADVDGDGRLDLIAVGGEQVAPRLSVLRGRTGGGFEEPVTYPVGDSPIHVGVGDLNGDGWPDLVTADQYAGGITVLVNDGSGGFPARTDVPTDSQPFGVSIGDLDGDTHEDVAVANYGANTVSVLRGVGDGTLAQWQTLGAAFGPTDALLADLDGDGDLDLAVTCYEINVVRLYRNDGTGSLAEVAVVGGFTGPWRVIARPLPSNPWPELVTANRKGVSLSLHVAVAGPFAYSALPVVAAGTNPSSVCAVDLDGDGQSDLVSTGFNSASLSVSRMSGAVPFLPSTYPAGGWPEAVVAGEFTGDAIADLAVANLHSATVSVFERRAAATQPAAVDDVPARPGLGAAFPNPASVSASIPFALSAAGRTRLSIVDLAGRRVRTLVARDLPAGAHLARWDGRDDAARAVSAGLYFFVLEAGERRESRRLMWLR